MSTAAPNRIMAAFLDQKERLLAALCDEGGLFEIRFLRRLLKREQVAVAEATTEAVEITVTVTTIRQSFLLDLAPDDNTPGVIDAEEAQRYLRELSALGAATRHHAGQLEQLN